MQTKPNSLLAAPPELLSTSNLLAHLNITRPTLFAWITKGFPRPMRFSARRLMWKVSEVEQWLQSRPRGKAHVPIGNRANHRHDPCLDHDTAAGSMALERPPAPWNVLSAGRA